MGNEASLQYWFGTHDCASQAIAAMGKIKSPELEPVLLTFVRNASQVDLLSRLPDLVFQFGQRFKLAEIAANLIKTGRPCYTGYPPEMLPTDFHELSEELGKIKQIQSDVLSGKVDSPFPKDEKIVLGSSTHDLGATLADERIRVAYDAIMSLQIVLAWTAFEVLAGDLWREAVNAHPTGLSDLRGSVGNSAKTTKAAGDQRDGKSISLVQLQKYKFNVSKSMGTLLIDERKVSFTSLEDIQIAYKRAFFEHADSILGNLNDWSLNALSVLRNLIVHRSLVCDDSYIDRTSEGKLPQLPKQG